MIAYHNTNAEFDKFHKDFIGKSDYGYAGQGFYFMPYPLGNSTYGKHELKVELDLKNPYRRTIDNWNTDALNPYIWIPARTEYLNGIGMERSEALKKASSDWTVFAEILGYDGFVDEAVKDGEIVAFRPEQITIISRGQSMKKNPTDSKFAKWFGNSKVVNADKTPKVVYHGTQATFTEFVRPKENGCDRLGPGFYFTDHPQTIDAYLKSGGKIIPVFLRMENPVTDGLGRMSSAQLDEFFRKIETHKFKNGYDATSDQERIIANALSSPNRAFDILVSSQHFFDSDEFRLGLLAAGIDGVISKFGQNHYEYVVFDSTQIKSAVGNTEYDSNNHNIFKNPPSPDFDELGIGSAAAAYRNKNLVEIITKSKRKKYDISRDIVIEARELLPESLKKYLPVIHRKRIDKMRNGTLEFIYEMPFYNKVTQGPEEPDSYTNYRKYGYEYPTEPELRKIESVLNSVMRGAYEKAGIPHVRKKAKFDGSYEHQDSLVCGPIFNIGWYKDGNKKVIVFRDPLFAWMPVESILKVFGSKFPENKSNRVIFSVGPIARYLKGCLS